MEDMRPVTVYLNAFHVLRIDIPADIAALFHNEHFLPRARQFMGAHRAVKSASDDEIIVHIFAPFSLCLLYLF